MWKEAFKNSTIVLGGVILSRLFVFLYNTMIIRQLSVEDYALFAFAMSVFNWVLIFSHLDLYAAVSRYVSENRALGKMAKAWSYYRHATIMAGLFSIVGIVVALLIATRQAYPFGALLAFMLSLLPMALLTVNDGYLKGFEKFGHSAFVETSGGVAKFVVLCLALLIIGTFDLANVLMLFLMACVLMFAVSTLCIRKIRTDDVSVPLQFKKAMARSLFNYSKWVCFTDLMNTGILFSGNLILSFQNSKDLALFNVVILIYSIFQIGFGAITTVLIPQVSRRRTNNENIRLLGMREFGFVAMATAVVIVCLISSPYRQDILLFLFDKPEYADALNYLAILLVAFPFRLMTMTNKGVVQGVGRPQFVAVAAFVTLATHILLFIPFYQLFGLAGCMTAMVCAYLVEFLLTKQAAHKALEKKPVLLSVAENY